MVKQQEKRYPQEIMATACIPWNEDWVLQEACFRKQIRNLVSRGIRHIYLFGTAGEGYAVTDEQFEEIVKVFSEEMNYSSLHPMVGLIHLSFPSMLKRLQIAYDMGIKEFQFSFPSWGALTDIEVESFMHALCDPYPDCKFLLYHIGRSKKTLQISDFIRLSNTFHNFVGAKYSTTDVGVIHGLVEMNSPLRIFFTELGFSYANMIGGDAGLLLSVGNSNIQRAQEFYQSAISGDLEKTIVFQQEVYGLLDAIIRSVGSGYIDGAYDKIFCKLVDSEFPLRLLPPYQSSTDVQYYAYKKELERLYPRWLESL